MQNSMNEQLTAASDECRLYIPPGRRSTRSGMEPIGTRPPPSRLYLSSPPLARVSGTWYHYLTSANAERDVGRAEIDRNVVPCQFVGCLLPMMEYQTRRREKKKHNTFVHLNDHDSEGGQHFAYATQPHCFILPQTLQNTLYLTAPE